MANVDNTIRNLELSVNWIDSPDHHFPGYGNVIATINNAISVLTEQKKLISMQTNALRGSADMVELLFEMLDKCVEKEEVKRILRSGVSLDTFADQNYVCALIDNLSPTESTTGKDEPTD